MPPDKQIAAESPHEHGRAEQEKRHLSFSVNSSTGRNIDWTCSLP
jgi:hypothetical protein